MDASLLAMPQFQNFNIQQPPTSVQTKFNGTLVASSLPKILAYSNTEQGNVMLYESNNTSLLLVLPPGLSISIPNVKFSDTPLPIPGNMFKAGYVFYKNQPEQLAELDKLLSPSWREQLSGPLPQPIVKKEPFLLARATINYNGHQFPASLWEYSDKSLVIFAPMDFSGGNDKLMKPWRGFVCPDSPSGKSDGYMIYKNTPAMVNFAKQYFNVPFETMYTKSPPVATAPMVKKSEPNLFETKFFMFNNEQVKMEFVEISSLAIALFPTPMIFLDGFNMQELYHPNGNKIPGYLIPKSQKDKITMIQNYFGLSDIESMYIMKEEVSQRSTIVQQQSNVGSKFSDLSINSFDDIPISTLIRLLKAKLDASGEIINKNEVTGQILIYGDTDKVIADAQILDEMKTEIEIKCGSKMAILLGDN